MGLVSDLRRRNVLGKTVPFAGAAWLPMQVAQLLIGLHLVPFWIQTVTFEVLAIGFPIPLRKARLRKSVPGRLNGLTID